MTQESPTRGSLHSSTILCRVTGTLTLVWVEGGTTRQCPFSAASSFTFFCGTNFHWIYIIMLNWQCQTRFLILDHCLSFDEAEVELTTCLEPRMCEAKVTSELSSRLQTSQTNARPPSTRKTSSAEFSLSLQEDVKSPKPITFFISSSILDRGTWTRTLLV